MGQDKHLSSIKFFLIFLVVWDHTTQYNLADDNVKLFTIMPLSAFVMPLFIMISGYLSKKINWRKYKRSALSLILTYIVFQVVYSLPAIVDVLFNLNLPLDSMGGKFDLLSFLLIPAGPLWYIVGLLFWRYMAFIIFKYKISFTLAMSVTVVLSMAIGFLGFSIPCSRILVFSPFFLLGFYCSRDFLEKVQKMKWIYFAIILSIQSALIVCFGGGMNFIYTSYGEVAYNSFPSLSYGFFARLIYYILALVGSICVFRLLPDTFYRWGNKSLDIYLLHPLFVYPIYYNFLFSNGLRLSGFIDCLAAIAIVIICILLSKIPTTKYLLNPMLLYIKFKR